MAEIVASFANVSKVHQAVSRKRWSLPETERVVALANVTFEITQNEVIGLIGRNGSGKSTLLRLLAGGTVPTKGKVWTKEPARLIAIGGIAFPDLSLRENAVLVARSRGFSRTEAIRATEELLQTVSLEDKANLQLRTLSTGMRAKFGVFLATLGQPKLVLMDEVLSVSDKSFEDSVLAEVTRIISGSSAAMIASHSEETIRKFCSRVIWLNQGRVEYDGPTDPGLSAYFAGAV